MRRVPNHAHWGAFDAVVADGRVVAALPFPADPAPSPLLSAIPEIVHSPLRIVAPAVRESVFRHGPGAAPERRGRERFVEVGWDHALRLVGGEIARVRDAHGAGGILGGSYGWSSAGRYHHARTQLRRFMFSGGGCVDQIGNYSWGAAQTFLPHVIGTYAPVSGAATDWPSLIAESRLILAFGGLARRNSQVASGGAGEHRFDDWLARARAAGLPILVIGPNRDDAPDGAEFLPIRPNTDTALMLALAHRVAATGRADRAFLDRYCTGYPRFLDYLTGASDGVAKDAAWAAPITGIPAETMLALADRLPGARCFVTAAWSLQRADHGEQPYWMLITLAAMLGGIGLPGGGFGFGHGSLGGVGQPRPAVGAPSFGQGANPARLAIPVSRLTEALERPGGAYRFNGAVHAYPDIRLVYWAGGNPFHHHQDLNRLRRAWTRPETVVVHDILWSPVARHADIVLPATTTLERNDIGAAPTDRYVRAMHQAIPPVGLARNDADILADLAELAGHRDSFSEGRDEAAWLRAIYAEFADRARRQGIAVPEFDRFWEAGYCELPEPTKRSVLFAAFRADPEAAPLATPSGRIEIVSERLGGFGLPDMPAHPTWLPPREWLGAQDAPPGSLHLVTTQPAHRLHSQGDTGPEARAAKVAGRETILLNPVDAAMRGIGDGDCVVVENPRGALFASARLADGLLAGVAMMATGAWFDPDDRPGAPERHGNPNVLTRDVGCSELTQAPSAKSVLVTVRRHDGVAEPVGIHRPPDMLRGPSSAAAD